MNYVFIFLAWVVLGSLFSRCLGELYSFCEGCEESILMLIFGRVVFSVAIISSVPYLAIRIFSDKALDWMFRQMYK